MLNLVPDTIKIDRNLAAIFKIKQEIIGENGVGLVFIACELKHFHFFELRINDEIIFYPLLLIQFKFLVQDFIGRERG